MATGRRERKKRELRERIMDAAADLIAEQSLARSAGYRDVARRDFFHRALLESGSLAPAQHRRFVSNQFSIQSLNSLRDAFDPPAALQYAVSAWRARPGFVPAGLLMVSAPLSAIARMVK